MSYCSAHCYITQNTSLSETKTYIHCRFGLASWPCQACVVLIIYIFCSGNDFKGFIRSKKWLVHTLHIGKIREVIDELIIEILLSLVFLHLLFSNSLIIHEENSKKINIYLISI